MVENDVVAKLKHVRAQVAIDPQPAIALSHGLAACGQQSSIASEADISAASCDFSLNAAAPAAGTMATDSAIRNANMVRAKVIFERTEYPVPAGSQSSDDFAT
jgi:hypothetical protein